MAAVPKQFKVHLGLAMSGDDMRRARLDINALNDIQDILWDYFCKVIAQAPTIGQFTPYISWFTKATEVADTDLVCYFVLSQSQSIITGLNLPQEAGDLGGQTSIGSQYGAISEVYVENNFPAKKLANIAFHELMHNKLQKNNKQLHEQTPGVGLGLNPANECSIMTSTDALLMSQRLRTPVLQYTGRLTGEIPSTKFRFRRIEDGSRAARRVRFPPGNGVRAV
jgi:hypothetical protein